MSYSLLPASAASAVSAPPVSAPPVSAPPAPAPPTTSSQYYTYFVPPPYISTIHKYQTVNGDKELQRKVTNYFLEKTLKWMKKDKSFSKKYLSNMKDNKTNFDIIHSILKLFVRRVNTNWYDLKEQSSLVKEFIKYKLSK